MTYAAVVCGGAGMWIGDGESSTLKIWCLEEILTTNFTNNTNGVHKGPQKVLILTSSVNWNLEHHQKFVSFVKFVVSPAFRGFPYFLRFEF
jgi:hypothetical protein